MTDWAARIDRHLTPEGVVMIPPRIAAWLEVQVGITGGDRIHFRVTDPQTYEVLAALHIAALHHRSGVGTESPMGNCTSRQLAMWLTTAAVAESLGVTDRAVRKQIATGHLQATKFGGRWLLNRNQLRIAQILA